MKFILSFQERHSCEGRNLIINRTLFKQIPAYAGMTAKFLENGLNKMKFILIFFFIFSSVNIYSEETLSDIFSGVVTDAQTDKPLQSATIIVKNTNIGTFASEGGEFKIKAKIGQILQISMIGYDTQSFTIIESKDNKIVIHLIPAKLLLDNIVVSAGRKVQAIQDVPISVSILGTREIEARNISSLDDMMRQIPGVQVNSSEISLRGSSGFAFGLGSRATLLIDGFPMLSADNGDMKFDLIPSSAIGRIEVVKGSGSALYGTSATGGVVNLISKKVVTNDKGFSLGFKSDYGVYTKPRFSEWEYSESMQKRSSSELTIGTNIDNLDILVSGKYTADDSWRIFDKSENISSLVKLDYQNENNRFEYLSLFSQTESDDWGFWQNRNKPFLPPIDTDKTIKLKSKQIAQYLKYQFITSSNIILDFKTGIFISDYQNSYKKDTSAYRGSSGYAPIFESRLSYNIFDNLFLTSGFELKSNITRSENLGNREQNIVALFSQAEYKTFEMLTLTTGIRFDYEKSTFSFANKEISPKLGLNLKLTDNFHIRSSVGSGFRAPVAAERFSEINFNGVETKPNLDLVPETSLSAEIGMSYESKYSSLPYFVDLAFFRNDMENLIEPKIDTDGKIHFINIGKARIIGTELLFRTFFTKQLGIELSLLAMDPQDLVNNKTLIYRSKFSSKNRVFLTLGDFRINLDYRYLSKVEEIDPLLIIAVEDARVRTDAHIVDLGIIYDFNINNQKYSFSLLGQNLLDYYYTETAGNMARTRHISFRFSTKL
jgi:outer membrane receptor for ferrienterochelin and colicins